MITPQFANLPCSAIVPSRSNRKYFDPAAMAELAADIKLRGVLSPILVRPLPASRLADTFENRTKGSPLPTHEIIFGERRWRASNVNSAPTIPVQIVDMTDAQALEAQLVENLQREDLTALDEAHGIEQLMAGTGVTIDEVAAKLNKSRRHVYDRLALLKLQPLTTAALREGKLKATAALAIATVHDGDLQAKALAHALSTDYNGEQPSTRNLQKWMRQNVLLDLSRAPFDKFLSKLHPSAGPCTTCPKRTGANPDLFADNPGPDSCCDAPCYHIKVVKSAELARKKYVDQGIRIIDGDDAQELSLSNYEPRYMGYSSLSQLRKDSPSGQPSTLLDLLGTKGQAEVGVVAIEHPQTKELRAFVPTDKAESWLEANGRVVPATAKTKATPTDAAKQLKHLLSRRDERVAEAGHTAACAAVDQAVLKAAPRLINTNLLTDELLRAYLLCQFSPWGHQKSVATALYCEREPGSDSTTYRAQFEAAVARAERSQLVRALVLDLVDTMRDGVDTDDDIAAVANAEAELYDTLHKDDQPDLADVVSAAELAESDAVKAEAAALQALAKPEKPEKTAPTHTPAAQPIGLAAADAKPGNTKKLAPLRKARLSAQDAQSGIAAAMQRIDASAVAAEAAPATHSSQVDAARPQLKQATPSNQGALLIGFVVGQRVKVIDSDTLPLMLRKYAGKVGTVKRKEVAGGEAYEVAFKGAKGGLADCRPEELEVAA